MNNTPSVVATSTAPTAPAVAEYSYGLSDGNLPYLAPADLLTRLRAIKDLGVKWVRFDFDWGYIQEEGPGKYNWDGFDRLAAGLNTVGLKGLGIISYTPTWARISGCQNDNRCAPADAAQFAAFAQTVVKRYSSQGFHTWEIWNEENLRDYWQPRADSAAYLDLLKKTYAAIKQQDAAAVVILGGMSPEFTANGNISPADFLAKVYAGGGKNYFDAVAFHPYSCPAMPSLVQQWTGWSMMQSTVPSVRSVMVANGDAAKQLWLTEFGAPTNGPGVVEASNTDQDFDNSPDHVTESLQAGMFADAIGLYKTMANMGPLFFYTWKDTGTSSNTIENFFGLLRFDDSAKPAYTVIKNMISAGAK